MNEFIDRPDLHHASGPFSKIALYSSVLVFVIIGLICIKISGVIKAEDSLWLPSVYVQWIVRVHLLLGIISLVMAYVRNEADTLVRKVASICVFIMAFISAAAIAMTWYVNNTIGGG